MGNGILQELILTLVTQSKKRGHRYLWRSPTTDDPIQDIVSLSRLPSRVGLGDGLGDITLVS